MSKIPDAIARFLEEQGFLIVSTIDAQGRPHSACKDIIKINRNGTVYLLDLYLRDTFRNLQRNPKISLTAVDGHKFKGYCLKGKDKLFAKKGLGPGVKKAWEARINSRLTQRILKNLHGEKGHLRHPELLLPRPEYMIVVEVEEVVDLTPQQLK